MTPRGDRRFHRGERWSQEPPAQQTTTPIAPSTTRTLIGDATSIHNLHLRLFTLLPKELVEKERRPEEKKENLKRRCYQDLEPLLKNAEKVLTQLAERQKRLLEAAGGPKVEPVCLQLTSNFTCGLSQPTPLENGLTLLRPYGIPILPASSIKGTISAWLAEILAGKLNLTQEEEERELRLRSKEQNAGFLPLFGYGPRAGGRGEDGQAGLITFFDALPIGGPADRHWLEVDITTVHHQSWYARKGDATPAGFESPVPIPFLTVRKGTRFAFCFLAPAEFELRPSLSSDKTKALNDFGVYPGKAPAAFLEDLLVSTSRYKGFGSQTAKGYGRMKRCK